MRVLVRDLSPGQKYILQFRSNTGTEVSEWSQKLDLQTSNDILAPKAVTGLTATVNGTAFKVAWNKVTQNTDNSELKDFKDYEVLVTSTADGQQQTYYVTQNHFDFPIEINQNAFGSPKAKLKFEVRARDINFNAVATYASATAQNPAPAAPTNFSATPVVNGVNLKWSAPSDKDLKVYRVYQGTSAGSTNTKVYEGLTTSFTYSNTNYTNQYFRVAAVDIFDQETLVTNAISAAPLAIDGSDTVPPANPTWANDWYTAETDVSNRFDIKVDAVLRWNANTESDLGAYVLRFKKAGDDAWVYRTVNGSATTPPATTTKVNDLTKGATYQFELAARDKKGNTSSYVAAPTSQMVAGDNVAPDKPSKPEIRGFLGQLIVRWDSKDNTGQPMAADTSHVEVHVSATSGFTPDNTTYKSRIDYAPNGGGEVVISNLTYGVQYFVKFIAVDYSNNTSPASDQSSGIPRSVTGVDITTMEIGPQTILEENWANGDTWMLQRGITRTNRIANPSGLDGTNGWGVSNGTLVVDQAVASGIKTGGGQKPQSGKYFNFAIGTAGGATFAATSAPFYPVTPGQWVSASANVWVTANRRARLRILFYQGATSLGSSGAYSDFVGGSTFTYGHKAEIAPVQAPAGADGVRFLIYAYEYADGRTDNPTTPYNIYFSEATLQISALREDLTNTDPFTGDTYNYALYRTTLTTSHTNKTGLDRITNGSDNNASGDYYDAGETGLHHVTVDLGAPTYIDRVQVHHYYHATQDRMYNGTKTEVSEDGVTWYAVFDSVKEGKYWEPNDGSGKTHYFGRRKVRYIRDWLSGNNVNTYNHWVQIKAFDGLTKWTGAVGASTSTHAETGVRNTEIVPVTVDGQETNALRMLGTEQWMTTENFIPFNPNKEYKFSVWARNVVGSYRIYIGWAGYDEFYRPISSNGLFSTGSAHWHAGAAQTPGANWTQYTGYTYAWGGMNGSGNTAPNRQLPGVMNPRVRYIKPYLLGNYQSGSNWTVTDFALLKVEEISFAESIIGRASIMDASIDSAKIAYLNAGKIVTGELAAGVRIIAGQESQQHAEMTSDGFYVKAPDDDGIMRDLVRMGTRTSDFISVPDPEEPEGVLASISDAGNISAQTLNVVGNEDGTGIMLGGRELVDIIDDLPKGVVANAYVTSLNLTDIGTEYGLIEVSWEHLPGREYKVSFGGTSWYTNQIGTSAIFRMRYTNDGSAPTINSTLVHSAFTEVASATSRASNGGTMIVTGRFNGNASTPRTIRLILTIARYYGTGAINLNTYPSTTNFVPFRIVVEDLGRDVQETSIINRGGGQLTGGVVEPPPPNPKKTYTSVWTANASEGYKGSGGARTDTTDMIQGYNSSNGDGHGMVLFTSGATSGETGKTLATALSGATINKVEVYLYANHWYYNSGGTAIIRAHSNTSLTSTTPSGTAITSSSWPKPGGRWVNITSIWSSARRGIWIGKAGTTNLQYYGRFNGHTGSNKPQLRITYTR